VYLPSSCDPCDTELIKDLQMLGLEEDDIVKGFLNPLKAIIYMGLVGLRTILVFSPINHMDQITISLPSSNHETCVNHVGSFQIFPTINTSTAMQDSHALKMTADLLGVRVRLLKKYLRQLPEGEVSIRS